MNNNSFKYLLGVLVIALVAVVVFDDDDIGDNLEEAAADTGRALEDATEELDQ
ncbi:MAG: hypothetical protein HWE25_15665 [Alphaproteobacteria bacterium]|nr:hypothetical protein [Alphaproteobacteria bacterium]